MALLGRAKEVSGGAVESFELIGALGMELALRHIPGARAPLESRPPWYVLIEIASGEPGAAEARWSGCWSARWRTAWSRTPPSPRPRPRPRRSGPCARTSRPPRRARARPGSTTSPCRSRASPSSSRRPARRCRRRWPGVRIDAFGHVGDGNIHYDVLAPRRRRSGGPQRPPRRGRAPGPRHRHGALEGSISAEHGLGTMKTAEALAYKSAGRGRGAAGGPRRAGPQADHEPAGVVLSGQGCHPGRSEAASRLHILDNYIKSMS